MELLQGADVEVVALCDVFAGALDETRARVTGPAPRFLRDYRQVLDASDVDVVLIATPDHWHAPMAVEACRAGKDVYLEKPLAHTIEEGRAIVDAARQSGRIVQVGLQQRSGSHYQEAKARYFDSGRIGRLRHVRTWWHGQNPRLLDPARDRRPEGLDWETFVGPASPRPFDARQFYQWRNYADFGEGQVGDLFTHWVDVAQWFMGEELPKRASAIGGIYHFPDGRDWPDTVSLLVEYPSGWTCSFEASLAPGARGLGVEFLGTEGRLSIDRNRYVFTPDSGDPETGGVEHDITRDHARNFVESVRNRTTPNAQVLSSHRSTLTSHLANLAYLRGEAVELDASNPPPQHTRHHQTDQEAHRADDQPGDGSTRDGLAVCDAENGLYTYQVGSLKHPQDAQQDQDRPADNPRGLTDPHEASSPTAHALPLCSRDAVKRIIFIGSGFRIQGVPGAFRPPPRKKYS